MDEQLLLDIAILSSWSVVVHFFFGFSGFLVVILVLVWVEHGENAHRQVQALRQSFDFKRFCAWIGTKSIEKLKELKGMLKHSSSSSFAGAAPRLQDQAMESTTHTEPNARELLEQHAGDDANDDEMDFFFGKIMEKRPRKTHLGTGAGTADGGAMTGACEAMGVGPIIHEPNGKTMTTTGVGDSTAGRSMHQQQSSSSFAEVEDVEEAAAAAEAAAEDDDEEEDNDEEEEVEDDGDNDEEEEDVETDLGFFSDEERNLRHRITINHLIMSSHATNVKEEPSAVTLTASHASGRSELDASSCQEASVPSCSVQNDCSPLPGRATLSSTWSQFVPFNSKSPIAFENDFFVGKVLILIRSSPLNDQWKHLFENRRRTFWIQVQGQFKRPVNGSVFIGGELPQRIVPGFFTKSLVHVIMGIIRKLIGTVSFSFGDKHNSEVPHVSFPLYQCADQFAVTPAGEEPPMLGKEDLGETTAQRNARKETPMGQEQYQVGTTYSFHFHTMYVDLLQWKTKNLPGLSDMNLTTFFENYPLRLVAYEMATTHASVDNSSNHPLTMAKQRQLQLEDATGTSRHLQDAKHYLFCFEIRFSEKIPVRKRKSVRSSEALSSGRASSDLIEVSSTSSIGDDAFVGSVPGNTGTAAAIMANAISATPTEGEPEADGVDPQLTAVFQPSLSTRAHALRNSAVATSSRLRRSSLEIDRQRALLVEKLAFSLVFWMEEVEAASGNRRVHYVLAIQDKHAPPPELATSLRANSLHPSGYAVLSAHQVHHLLKKYVTSLDDAPYRFHSRSRIGKYSLIHDERQQIEKLLQQLADDTSENLEMTTWKAALFEALRKRTQLEMEVDDNEGVLDTLHDERSVAPISQHEPTMESQDHEQDHEQDQDQEPQQHQSTPERSTDEPCDPPVLPVTNAVPVLRKESRTKSKTKLRKKSSSGKCRLRKDKNTSIEELGIYISNRDRRNLRVIFEGVIYRFFNEAFLRQEVLVVTPQQLLFYRTFSSTPDKIVDCDRIIGIQASVFPFDRSTTGGSSGSNGINGGGATTTSWSAWSASAVSSATASVAGAGAAKKASSFGFCFQINTFAEEIVICVASEHVRNTWIRVLLQQTDVHMNFDRHVDAQEDTLYFCYSPMVGMKPSRRVILNSRVLFPSSLGGDRHTNLRLVQKVLQNALEFHNGKQNVLHTLEFLNNASRLRLVDLTAFPSHEDKLAFYLNLYHVVVAHAMISHGFPSSKSHWEHFLTQLCYVVGIQRLVVSLADIEHVLLRARMPVVLKLPHLRYEFPRECKRNLDDPCSLASQFGLDHPDFRISLALLMNNGSDHVLIFDARHCHEQLNWICQRWLQSHVRVYEAKNTIVLPKICEWYQQDFGGNGADMYCVRKILGFLDEVTRARALRLLDSNMATIQVRYLPFEYTPRESLQLATTVLRRPVKEPTTTTAPSSNTSSSHETLLQSNESSTPDEKNMMDGGGATVK